MKRKGTFSFSSGARGQSSACVWIALAFHRKGWWFLFKSFVLILPFSVGITLGIFTALLVGGILIVSFFKSQTYQYGKKSNTLLEDRLEKKAAFVSTLSKAMVALLILFCLVVI